MGTTSQGTYNAITSPAQSARNIATTTADVFAPPTIGIVAHSAANLQVTFVDDSSTVIIPVAAGTFYPFRLKSVDVANVVVFTALFAGVSP
jgi:hypothetical protein